MIKSKTCSKKILMSTCKCYYIPSNSLSLYNVSVLGALFGKFQGDKLTAAQQICTLYSGEGKIQLRDTIKRNRKLCVLLLLTHGLWYGPLVWITGEYEGLSPDYRGLAAREEERPY